MAYRAAVLDVDGTIVRGDDPVPGAAVGLRRLREHGVEPLFVSNNPRKTPAEYARRLSRAGFDVDADRVLTAGSVSASFLRDRHRDDPIYLVGENGLAAQLREAGIELVAEAERAAAIVVSIDRRFDYDELCTVLWALEDDVLFYGTDPDVVIPATPRMIPGSGAFVNLVSDVTGREPDAVFGKPNEPTLRAVLDRVDCDPVECLVVGDRADTDVALGRAAGMTTALVLTGVTDEDDLECLEARPDYVLDSLAEIGRVLEDGPRDR